MATVKMANYFVLHARKIKTMTGCIEVIKHNLRKKDNLDSFVDITRSHLNFYSGATNENFLVEFNELTANLPRKIQKNASRLIEFVVSFSHEYGKGWENDTNLKKKIEAYFIAADSFLKRRFGDVIICRTDHYDEKTPHSHFLLIPICKDKKGILRFSSSEFLGGKSGLFDLHDKFEVEVGAKFGLERGVRESRTSHSDLKNYDEWEKTQRIITEKKLEDLNKEAEILQKQKGQLAEKVNDVNWLKKRLFDLTGDVMKRSDSLTKRELKNADIEKAQKEQIPQIPLPPATLTENLRKKWREDVQQAVNEAFKRLTGVVIHFKTKYENLLEKHHKLIILNEKNEKRAESAERDLREKPIKEIEAARKPKEINKPVQGDKIETKVKSHKIG